MWKFWVIMAHHHNGALVLVNHYTSLSDAEKRFNDEWLPAVYEVELIELNEERKPIYLKRKTL